MGEDVKGLIVYSSDGYMSAHIQSPGQKNFNSSDLNGGSEQELAEAARRHFGYTGPFYLDESGPELILKHHMSLSTFPNWLGNTQRRVVKMEDDVITLSPEAPIEIFVYFLEISTV
jgi:Lipocalin-like domain